MVERVKIIAEIGINHNGNLDLALQLCSAAKLAGADYVKFQRRNPPKCYTNAELDSPCVSPWGTTVREKVWGRELKNEDWRAIDSHCKKIGIEWSASCWDWESFLAHEEFHPPWHKVASTMALNRDFVQNVANRRKLTLISTGLLDNEGIDAIVRIFDHAGCPFVLMHCVALYPCPVERLNLRCLLGFQNILGSYSRPTCKGIGYSGHEVGIGTTPVALAFGATWIERHLTLDRSLPGADHAASIEPQGLAQLIRHIRSVELALGDGAKRLYGDEKRAISVGISKWW